MIRVERTRGAGRYTEAGVATWFKGGFRKMSMRWKPISMIKMLATIKQKFINPETGKYCMYFKCEACEQDFPKAKMCVDHKEPIVPKGKTFKPPHLAGFDPDKHVDVNFIIERMFVEIEGLQVLCQRCNALKSDMSMAEWLETKDSLIASDFVYTDRNIKKSRWKVKGKHK